jgi:hypothetical protein
MNKEQGDTCESFATFYYTSLGCIVSKPLTHSPYYDLIVDTDGVLKKVECKSSRFKDNPKSYTVALGTTGGNQSWNKVVKKIDAKKVDEIFILDGDGNYYIYNSKDLHNKRKTHVNSSLKTCIGNQKQIVKIP